ncbi:unnamed protein product [Paramecium primaurelia]|uniref:Uncharacterized protein n=1 Tax=Paramecium primaurelia TaxID=5886 RepID=A0A8S1QQT3_PARPR|nr:unnamed protein product [Paramecium primaurelia]
MQQLDLKKHQLLTLIISFPQMKKGIFRNCQLIKFYNESSIFLRQAILKILTILLFLRISVSVQEISSTIKKLQDIMKENQRLNQMINGKKIKRIVVKGN